MKPSRLLPFTILIATTTLLGQNVVMHHQRPGPNSASGDVVAEECPVGMAIDRSGLYMKREVAGAQNADSNPELEQRIRLDLTNRNPTKIISAQITVHGLSQKGRFIEVSTPEADMAKTIQLSLDLKGNGQSSNDLWLTRFAVITRVAINSVTYADGSTWYEPSPAACGVAPNLFVLVSLDRLTVKHGSRRSLKERRPSQPALLETVR
jgi:hypothetical protein